MMRGGSRPSSPPRVVDDLSVPSPAELKGMTSSRHLSHFSPPPVSRVPSHGWSEDVGVLFSSFCFVWVSWIGFVFCV